MTTTIEPPLAAPGAGLPALELLIARFLFGLRRRAGDRESFTAKFRFEREKIRTLLGSCAAEAGGRRVLIRRPPGLEDSSRNWSVWMTLDHLRIVHREMIRIIGALTQGRAPEGKASTAAVKPSPAADASVVTAYEASCDGLLASAADLPNLEPAARFAHPWFGPLSAVGWYALASGHLGVHRVQIARIIAGLPRC